MAHMFITDYEEGQARRELLEKLFAFMDAHPIELSEEQKEEVKGPANPQPVWKDDDAAPVEQSSGAENETKYPELESVPPADGKYPELEPVTVTH